MKLYRGVWVSVHLLLTKRVSSQKRLEIQTLRFLMKNICDTSMHHIDESFTV